MCLQQFVKPFCEEAEIAFFHPNPSISAIWEMLAFAWEEAQNAFSQAKASISQIAVNLRLKHKTKVSFRLLSWVVA